MKIKFKKFLFILYFPAISFFIYIFYLFFNSNKKNEILNIINENEILTINMAELPVIPWNSEQAAGHIIETFTAAVHGSLAPIYIHGSIDNTNQNTLLESYSCKELTCFAKLKKGVYFHNNREVTAYDLEFSLIKQLIAQKDSNYTETILDDIVGINNVKNEKVKIIKFNNIEYPSKLVEGIQVKNKYNIEFKLKRKNNYFFYRIIDGKIPIVPIEELKKDYINWKKYPVGFGKYKVTDVDFNNYIFYLERVNLSEKIPKKVRLIFSSNETGDIKLLLGKPNIGNEQNEHRLIFPNVYSNAGFLYNFQTELGKNENFRKAISLALDRDKIARSSYFNELSAEDQFIPNSGYFKEFRADIPIQQQNIKEAKRLLNLIPHNLWKNKIFQVPTYWEDAKEINTLPYIKEIQTQLANVGIQTIFLNTNNDYDKFGDNDPNVFWFTGFSFATSDPNKNFAHFKSGSYFKHEHHFDPIYELLYEESANKIYNNPNSVKMLSKYFTQKNIMTIIFNLRMTLSYNPQKVISLGNQYNGIRFAIWEVKIRSQI